MNLPINQVICGDCLGVMKDWPANIFDTIITDPPYGLSFMGKKWDYDVPSVEFWREALRVLKPGGTLLCFAGSRTQHRMAVNIEDAGFVLKDCIMWLYGSGFPKATDISKQLDKQFGHHRGKAGKPLGNDSRRAFGQHYERTDKGSPITAAAAAAWEGWKSHGLKPAYEPIIVAMKPNEGSYAENALKYGVSGLNIDGARIETDDNLNGGGYNTKGTSKKDLSHATSFAIPVIDKEFVQPLGRFPANVILGCSCDFIRGGLAKRINDFEDAHPEIDSGWFSDLIADVYRGRHNPDCPVAMLDEQSGESKSRASGYNFELVNQDNPARNVTNIKSGVHFTDSGGASRFFYTAKAGKAERNAGCEGLETKDPDNRTDIGKGSYTEKGIAPQKNHHPTVKPLDLMRYLVKLTATPTGGIVLDPFCGSGTTLMACVIEGRDYIGIDKEPEYVAIANKRLEVCKAGVPVKEAKAGQGALFKSVLISEILTAERRPVRQTNGE